MKAIKFILIHCDVNLEFFRKKRIASFVKLRRLLKTSPDFKKH